VKDEVSFNKLYKNGDNIYRIVTKSGVNGSERKNSNTGFLRGLDLIDGAALNE
jgi:hypothetical protein